MYGVKVFLPQCACCQDKVLVYGVKVQSCRCPFFQEGYQRALGDGGRDSRELNCRNRELSEDVKDRLRQQK